MSENYATEVSRHRRLAILRHLEASPEYIGNASILQSVLVRLGLPLTYDEVITELVWLKEQGMVTLEGDAFVVATASRRGVEVAQGLATHPGIQRPRPRF